MVGFIIIYNIQLMKLSYFPILELFYKMRLVSLF